MTQMYRPLVLHGLPCTLEGRPVLYSPSLNRYAIEDQEALRDATDNELAAIDRLLVLGATTQDKGGSP